MRATKGADGIAVIEVLVETSNPFTTSNGVAKGSSETGRAELRKGRNGEQLSNERGIVVSTLVHREIEECIRDIRADGGIKTVDV